MAPKQRSLLEFACLGTDQAEQAARDAAREAKLARRTQVLEALGLAWPEPPRRGAGRPTHQEEYDRALYRAIRMDEDIDLDRVSRPRPNGWRPGDALAFSLESQLATVAAVGEAAEAEGDAPEEAAEDVPEASVKAVPEASVEAAGQAEDAVVDAEDEVGEARSYVKVKPEAKEFAMDYFECMQQQKSWTRVKCLENLKHLGPDMYGHLDYDTVRKWRRPKKPTKKAGRPPKVPAGVLMRIVEILQGILAQDARNSKRNAWEYQRNPYEC